MRKNRRRGGAAPAGRSGRGVAGIREPGRLRCGVPPVLRNNYFGLAGRVQRADSGARRGRAPAAAHVCAGAAAAEMNAREPGVLHPCRTLGGAEGFGDARMRHGGRCNNRCAGRGEVVLGACQKSGCRVAGHAARRAARLAGAAGGLGRVEKREEREGRGRGGARGTRRSRGGGSGGDGWIALWGERHSSARRDERGSSCVGESRGRGDGWSRAGARGSLLCDGVRSVR